MVDPCGKSNVLLFVYQKISLMMKIGEVRRRECSLKADNIVNEILNKNIESKKFIEHVLGQWKRRQFVTQCGEISALQARITSYAEGIRASFHGRKNQPLSTSCDLFGGSDTVSARLVFDPLTDKRATEGVEPHIHPVASIIVVTQGNGEFFLLYVGGRRRHYIRVPLTPGTVVSFPAGVVHTMKPGNEGIQTLNVTDRQNLPPGRGDHNLAWQVQTMPLCFAMDFSTPADIPEDAEHVDYLAFSECVEG